jgi:hypothetical protein
MALRATPDNEKVWHLTDGDARPENRNEEKWPFI